VLLELFSTTSAPCARKLDDLARHATELARAGLAPLALSVEGIEEGEQARAAAFLRERNWPFPWATASPAALELLDALQCILLDRERRLPLPASFLVDANGALRVLYLGPVTAEQLLADRALCELDEGALFDTASPFPGRWMFPALPSDADFFEGRLRARGLDEPAGEFTRARLAVVRTAPADLLQDFGRQSAVAGRFEEAEKFFRRALATDPRHFGALFDLAVVLQREERLAEARELYGKALALQPEHADAHFNLALVQVAQGDLEGAERELRWLKTHGLEDLEDLERALEARKQGK
jgi:tetratricopeptide (TPR) repeat protein